MLKFTINLLIYALTLTLSLCLAPLVSYHYQLVSIDTLPIAIVLAPLVMWATYYVHGVVYEVGSDFIASSVASIQRILRYEMHSVQISLISEASPSLDPHCGARRTQGYGL